MITTEWCHFCQFKVPQLFGCTKQYKTDQINVVNLAILTLECIVIDSCLEIQVDIRGTAVFGICVGFVFQALVLPLGLGRQLGGGNSIRHKKHWQHSRCEIFLIL